MSEKNIVIQEAEDVAKKFFSVRVPGDREQHVKAIVKVIHKDINDKFLTHLSSKLKECGIETVRVNHNVNSRNKLTLSAIVDSFIRDLSRAAPTGEWKKLLSLRESILLGDISFSEAYKLIDECMDLKRQQVKKPLIFVVNLGDLMSNYDTLKFVNMLRNLARECGYQWLITSHSSLLMLFLGELPPSDQYFFHEYKHKIKVEEVDALEEVEGHKEDEEFEEFDVDLPKKEIEAFGEVDEVEEDFVIKKQTDKFIFASTIFDTDKIDTVMIDIDRIHMGTIDIEMLDIEPIDAFMLDTNVIFLERNSIFLFGEKIDEDKKDDFSASCFDSPLHFAIIEANIGGNIVLDFSSHLNFQLVPRETMFENLNQKLEDFGREKVEKGFNLFDLYVRQTKRKDQINNQVLLPPKSIIHIHVIGEKNEKDFIFLVN